MTTEFENLPKRVQHIILVMRNGQKLCKSLRMKETGETEISFVYEPSGKRVGPKSADAAIKSGLLRPMGDGLLGDEFSQSWAASS